MSNQVEKFGLRPYRKLDGTPLVGAQNRYTIASGLAGAIFQGEMVQPRGAGGDRAAVFLNRRHRHADRGRAGCRW